MYLRTQGLLVCCCATLLGSSKDVTGCRYMTPKKNKRSPCPSLGHGQASAMLWSSTRTCSVYNLSVENRRWWGNRTRGCLCIPAGIDPRLPARRCKVSRPTTAVWGGIDSGKDLDLSPSSPCSGDKKLPHRQTILALIDNFSLLNEQKQECLWASAETSDPVFGAIRQEKWYLLRLVAMCDRFFRN
jgi:hypothetical protein